jgi:hypothetical protein
VVARNKREGDGMLQAATADLELDLSHNQADYAIFINANNWKAGDCFRVRLVADDDVVGHFLASAYSNKLCLPTT